MAVDLEDACVGESDTDGQTAPIRLIWEALELGELQIFFLPRSMAVMLAISASFLVSVRTVIARMAYLVAATETNLILEPSNFARESQTEDALGPSGLNGLWVSERVTFGSSGR